MKPLSLPSPFKQAHAEWTPETLALLAFRYAGKLLLRDEIHLDDTLFHTLINQGYFHKTPSIERYFLYARCMRCGNRKHSMMGHIPCKKCGKTHLYCRNCIQMGRVMECEPLYIWTGPDPEWKKHTDACTWSGELTAVQQYAAEKITETIQKATAELLIWAVCGAGKTEMLFSGIEQALNERKRICVATPRSDVVRELLPRMQTAFSAVHVQGLYEGSEDNDGTAQLIISTTHQLFRYQKAFDVMIIDEVDAFPYHADSALVYATSRAVKQTHATIYLTATPRKTFKNRIEAKKLPCVYVPSRFHGHPLPVPVFQMSFSLEKDLKKNQPPKVFFHWMNHRKTPERQVLIFVPTVSLAERMTDYLRGVLTVENLLSPDFTLEYVHAADEERNEKITQFRERKINMLVTTTILERGVTFPSVDVAVLDAAHDVFDEAALIQIAGRAGRSANDPDGEVVFFHSGKTKAMTAARYSIQAMNKRGGLD